MNRLEEMDHQFVPLDYKDLIERIRQRLKEEPLFLYNPVDRKLYVMADKIARAICDEPGLKDPLRARGREASFATVYLKDDKDFASRIGALYEEVGEHLLRATDDPASALAGLTRPLLSWKSKSQKIGLRYPFTPQTNLAKQRLSIDKVEGTRPVLRFPKLTINVENGVAFEEQVVSALHTIAEQWTAGDGRQQEEVEEILGAMQREAGSDLLRLRRVVDQESLGRLKREGTVIYLEYLTRHLPKWENGQIVEEQGRWLADLVERLRLIEQYLSNPERGEGDFLLSYAGSTPVDLRDLMARSDAYDQLPIVGQISGTLGELTEPTTGTRRFHLGLKLKLGGRVMKEPDQPLTFGYYLTRLNPTDAAHQRELASDTGEWFRQRVLKLAFVYFVALHQLGDLEFDPISAFEQAYLLRLTSNDMGAQREALHEIATLLDIPELHNKVQTLRKWLKNRMKEQARDFPKQERTRYLSVQRGILLSGPDEVERQRTFFKNTFGYDGKNALKYLVLSDDPVAQHSLASLAVTFTIEHLHYYVEAKEEPFAMTYAVDNIPTLPMILAPLQLTADEKEQLKKNLDDPGGLMMPYTPGFLADLERPDAQGRRPDGKKAFAYRLTVTLLSYLALAQLRDYLPEDSFVPILRLHVRPKEEKNPEDHFLHALSKVLAHLLGEKQGRASAQGFDLSKLFRQGERIQSYLVSNALASLYADLPKRFTVEPAIELEKLAVVVVSSHVSDRPRSGAGKLSTLFGEVISFVRTGTQVQVERRETFADTYDEKTLYRDPTVLIDLFGRLHQDGYRDVLFLAKAPFTSTLNVTGEVQELYFMSPPLLEKLVSPWPDLKLYPIFFDRYAVMKLPAYKGQAQSLYVDDTRQLQRLVRDDSPTRQAAVFFNLFNGRDFGSGSSDHGFYNWVISYATLLNMHEGVLEDQHLREGLIYQTPRKRDILTFLTLLHFARYEAARGGQGGITLKLNAYEHLIGDEASLGKLAEWPHAMGGCPLERAGLPRGDSQDCGRAQARCRLLPGGMMARLGEDLGRLFEVGFNLGLLRAFEAGPVSYPNRARYREELARLKLAPLARALAERIEVADEQGRKVVRQWAIYFLTRGLVGGLSFWQELAASLGQRALTVRYLQMRFDSDNALGTVERDESEVFDAFLGQVGVQDAGRRVHYSQRGRFLRADTLFLVDAGRGGYHLVSLDLSIFTVAGMRDLKELTRPAVLRQLLASELRYARSRGQFTRLSIDTEPGEMPFADGLERYYQAFIREDKESAKLIQAGSYAHSFYRFLQEFGLLEGRPVSFHVFGYTDRSINALTLTEADLPVLERCATLYQNKAPASPAWQEERSKVLDTIVRHASRSFGLGGKDFLKELLAIKSGSPKPVKFREQVTDFTNTGGPVPPEIAAALELDASLSLRDAHAALIRRALEPSHPAKILFLTGNPGIGKTTSLVDFLRDHREEGFLLLYVSPRTQVNRDLLGKFEAWLEVEDEAIALHSSASLIEAQGGQSAVVAYRAPARDEPFELGPVRFVPDVAQTAPAVRRGRLRYIADDAIADTGKPNRGVLASVCEGIYQLLKAGETRSIVATVSIQSLKRTNRGDTLAHLEKIFRDGYNERTNNVLWERLRAMSSRTRHLFVMVDEITGDEAGPAFLEGLLERLKRLGLLNEQSGFNSKIIVADASIVEGSVIQAHLASAEPDRDKIYFRKAPPGAAALEVQPFTFRNQPAIAIGANSYPASALNLMYSVYVDVTQMDERGSAEGVRNRLEQGICQDVLRLLQRDADETRQIIVYLQDKARIGELVSKIGSALQAEGKSWEPTRDYLEIHASLSDAEKNQLNEVKDNVRVVFMTSSASRGLSFPFTRHILVAIPGFAVEQNLMEIIQVIYRGRGRAEWDAKPKTLLFYLAEQIFYGAEGDRERAVTERLLSLVSLLLVLKLSILTRIQGYRDVGVGARADGAGRRQGCRHGGGLLRLANGGVAKSVTERHSSASVGWRVKRDPQAAFRAALAECGSTDARRRLLLSATDARVRRAGGGSPGARL